MSHYRDQLSKSLLLMKLRLYRSGVTNCMHNPPLAGRIQTLLRFPVRRIAFSISSFFQFTSLAFYEDHTRQYMSTLCRKKNQEQNKYCYIIYLFIDDNGNERNLETSETVYHVIIGILVIFCVLLSCVCVMFRRKLKHTQKTQSWSYSNSAGDRNSGDGNSENYPLKVV